MVTTVGLQTDFMAALRNLVELDYDAIEAYDAAINRLQDEGYKASFKKFKEDHQRHIQELSEFLKNNNEAPPTAPGAKSLLTKGKVILANLMGDKTILLAMQSNEIDTNTAYGRVNNYENIPSEIKASLEKGLQDEKRHLAWIEEQLD